MRLGREIRGQAALEDSTDEVGGSILAGELVSLYKQDCLTRFVGGTFWEANMDGGRESR